MIIVIVIMLYITLSCSSLAFECQMRNIFSSLKTNMHVWMKHSIRVVFYVSCLFEIFSSWLESNLKWMNPLNEKSVTCKNAQSSRKLSSSSLDVHTLIYCIWSGVKFINGGDPVLVWGDLLWVRPKKSQETLLWQNILHFNTRVETNQTGKWIKSQYKK